MIKNSKIYFSDAFFVFLLLAAVCLTSCVTTGGGAAVSDTKTGAIISVDSVTEYSDKVVISLKANQPISYTPYRLESPLHLVLDIPDATFADAGNVIDVNDGTIGAIKKLSVDSEGKTVARLEVYFLNDANYFITKPEENNIVIDVQKPEGISSAPITSDEGSPLVEEKWETAATKIVNITTDKKSTGTKIAIIGDGRVDSYESFVLDDPYRLVVDVKGVTSDFPKSELAVGGGDVSTIRIGIHPDKVRFVFESSMKNSLNAYRVYSVENKLMVVFRENLDAEDDTSSPPSTDSGSPATVKDITFEDNADFSRVLISTSAAVEYNAKMVSDKKLVLDIPNAVAGENLKKQLKATSSNSPITTISTYRTEGNGTSAIRVIVELNKSVPHKDYRKGESIVLDFAKSEDVALGSDIGSISPEVPSNSTLGQPVTLPGSETTTVKGPEVLPPVTETGAGGPTDTTETKYTGKKITLIFTAADIRNIFQLIAEVSNLNILIDSDVQGRVTLRLNKVPWDQALDIILTSNNLGAVRDGNVIRIATREKLEKERSSVLASKRALEEVEDLITKKVDLSYTSVVDVSKVIEPMLSSRGKIAQFVQTNSLLITDIPSYLDPILDIIKKLDMPIKEIRIEARIVEINDNFDRELGINWAIGYNATDFADNVYKTAFGTLDSTTLNIASLFDPLNTIFPIVPESADVGPGGGSAVIGLLGDAMRLEVQLKMLERMGEAELIESPRLRVLNNAQAEFTITRKIPIRNIKEETSAEGNVSTSGELDYQEFLTRLMITPSITEDRKVKLTIELEHATQGDAVVLNIGNVNNTYYIEDYKKLTTEVLVDNRDTVVIGGLYRKENTDIETGLPLMKDIPVLGWLFKTKLTGENRRELLIFITPTIVRENEEELSDAGK